MYNIRVGAFETNSSNYHSFSIHIGDYKTITCYDEYERDDVYLEEGDVDEILDNIPIEKLENAIAYRKNKVEREKKYEELENQANAIWRQIHDNCRDCRGNGCDDCRDCDIKKTNDELRRQLDKIEVEERKLF